MEIDYKARAELYEEYILLRAEKRILKEKIKTERNPCTIHCLKKKYSEVSVKVGNLNLLVNSHIGKFGN